jgi:hypothetical protein
VLYAVVNLQEGKWPEVNHELAWSTNFGATWTMAGWRLPKGAGHFQPASFLNFGKDYSGVPERLAGYVYLYGAKRASDPKQPAQAGLARVPVDRVRERAAYEFFQGVDPSGETRWTQDESQLGTVCHDPSDDGPGTVVYAPALKRYLMGSFHGGPGHLSVFDAPNPWGPWTTVGYYEHFGGCETKFFCKGLYRGFWHNKYLEVQGLHGFAIFQRPCRGAIVPGWVPGAAQSLPQANFQSPSGARQWRRKNFVSHPSPWSLLEFGGVCLDLVQIFLRVFEEILFAVRAAEFDFLALIDKHIGRAHFTQFITGHRAGGQGIGDGFGRCGIVGMNASADQQRGGGGRCRQKLYHFHKEVLR